MKKYFLFFFFVSFVFSNNSSLDFDYQGDFVVFHSDSVLLLINSKSVIVVEGFESRVVKVKCGIGIDFSVESFFSFLRSGIDSLLIGKNTEKVPVGLFSFRPDTTYDYWNFSPERDSLFTSSVVRSGPVQHTNMISLYLLLLVLTPFVFFFKFKTGKIPFSSLLLILSVWIFLLITLMIPDFSVIIVLPALGSAIISVLIGIFFVAR